MMLAVQLAVVTRRKLDDEPYWRRRCSGVGPVAIRSAALATTQVRFRWTPNNGRNCCSAQVGRFVPCVDGSALARTFCTSHI